MYSDAVLHGDPWPTTYEPNLLPAVDIERWHHGGGAITPYTSVVRPGGCTWFYSRTVTLKSGLNGLFVCLVEIYGTKYVVGLRFVFGNGLSTSLGYVIPGKEETYIAISSSTGAGGANLKGFRLAVCLRGIVGIAAITANGETTQWAGSYTGFARMTLVARHRVRHVRGNFDVRATADVPVPSHHAEAHKF